MDEDGYKKIQKKVIDKYESINSKVGDNDNPRAGFAACLIRLAGHDFMDFRHDEAQQGGSDGCVNFDDPDNKGLQKCIVGSCASDLHKANSKI